MSAIKLPYTRFVKQANTGLTSILGAAPAAAHAESLLIAAPWILVAEQLSDWPVRNATQTGVKDTYDAYKFVGDYANGSQKVYVGASAYRFEIPPDAFAPVAEVLSISVPLHVDRWLVDGVRLAALLSSSDIPPDDWQTVRAGDVSDDALLPMTFVEGSPVREEKNDTVILEFPAETEARKYLYIFITLEDYRSTRDFWLEGGALLVGIDAEVTFSREINTSLPTVLPILATNKYREGGNTEVGPLDLVKTTGMAIPLDEDIEGDWQRFEAMLRYWAASEKTVSTAEVEGPEAPWQNLRFKIYYGGSADTGAKVRVNVFDSNLMHGSPTAVGQFNTPVSYPADVQMTILSGTIPTGSLWFWVFVDNDSDGEFKSGIPAGRGFANVGPTMALPIEVTLYDNAPPGYARRFWALAGDREYNVTISANNNTPGLTEVLNRSGTSGRPKIIGREYLHEGDFIAHSANGYSPSFNHLNGVALIANPLTSGSWGPNNPGYQGGGAAAGGLFALAGTPFEALTTPTVELPDGTITGTRTPLVRWNSGSIHKFSTYDLECKNASETIVVNFVRRRFPALIDSKYHVLLPPLDDGVYQVRVRTLSPDQTAPKFASAWSSWKSFTIAYEEPSPTTSDIFAGLVLTSATVGEAHGWGNCTLRGHTHQPRHVTTLQFLDAIPPGTPLIQIRLVCYLETNPAYRPEAGNESVFGAQSLTPEQWRTPSLWRGEASGLSLTGDGQITVAPVLSVLLDPLGYDAGHIFPVDMHLDGPFNLHFFASPVAMTPPILSADIAVDQKMGLQSWHPSLLKLS